MSSGTALPPRFDRTRPEVLDDPYERYAELRRAGPLARGGPGTWLVTRHRDVARLLGDPRLSNAFPPEYHRAALGDGAAGSFFGRILFHRDPPVHTRLRRLMAAQFTPRQVARVRPAVERTVDDLLTRALDAGRFDAVGDFANPLALTVICRLLGVPPADQREVLPRATALAQGFTITPDADARRATDDAVSWLREYVGALLGERVGTLRRDDLLGRMLAATDGSAALSHDDIVDNAVFLFWAGFETVVSVIATGCAALLDHEPAFRQLRERPALSATAVEEFMRYDAPIQGTSRIVREPIEVGGRRIRPGRVLVLLIGSANRDEAVFARAGALDVTRDPNPHLSFGGGDHRCLGRVLARVEATVAFERLAARVGALGATGPVIRRMTSTAMRFHESIPLTVEAAPR